MPFALFSDLSDNHLLDALLEPSLPSRVEREETLNTPFRGGMVHTCNPSWTDFTDTHNAKGKGKGKGYTAISASEGS